MGMLSKEEILEVIQPVLQEDQFFVVDIQVSINKIRSKLVILLDSDEGIGIDQCGALSREIGALLDEKIEDAYVLEVSSPGVDTPLRLARQYKKNVGRSVKVVLNDGQVIKGKLEMATEDSCEVLPESTKKKQVTEVQTIKYSDIKQTTVQVSFK
ncbi:MAG: ribosome maturation factor RimP [Spirosomataceae bacterium]